ncbi:MAG: M48 family metallopeptidase [Moraxellaceae bacterium]
MSATDVVSRYLAGYPAELQSRARQLLAGGQLADYLRQRYPDVHAIQTDKALYHYVNEWRQAHLRRAPAIDKVLYDSRLDVLKQALGLHTAVSRVHGGRLVASKEIRIAGLFREAPLAFLEAIVVHELAHLRELEHNKAFYQLCEHMLPDYHRREFDLRLYLVARAASH